MRDINSYIVHHLEKPQNGKRWCISAYIEGKRVRAFFDTEAEAQEEARLRNIEIGTGGVRATLPIGWRVAALEASEQLAQVNATLADAVDFYLAAHTRRNASKPLSEVTREFIESVKRKVSRGDASRDHLAGIKKTIGKFSDRLLSSLVSEIDKPDISTWLDSLDMADSSRDFYRRYSTTIFAFALEQGYCASNPVSGIKKRGNKGSIGILTPDEVEAILYTCAPQILPYYAVGTFAGLRPLSEITHLDWSHFDWNDHLIEVQNIKTAKHDRTPRERYVDMSGNLCAWLRLYRKESGRVMPGNWRDYVYGRPAQDRRAKKESDRTKAIAWLEERKLPVGNLKQWPHDAIRHSFASTTTRCIRTKGALLLRWGTVRIWFSRTTEGK
jgi:integrase